MTDIPKNMQVFNIVVLRLFDKLYESFPIPITVNPSSLGIAITPDEAPGDDAWNAMSVADNALPWLAKEDFIRYKSSDTDGAFHEIQLTLKGLSILGSVPNSIQHNETPETIIAKIKRVLASGAKKASAEAIKAVLTEVFKMALLSAVSTGSSGSTGSISV